MRGRWCMDSDFDWPLPRSSDDDALVTFLLRSIDPSIVPSIDALELDLHTQQRRAAAIDWRIRRCVAHVAAECWKVPDWPLLWRQTLGSWPWPRETVCYGRRKLGTICNYKPKRVVIDLGICIYSLWLLALIGLFKWIVFLSPPLLTIWVEWEKGRKSVCEREWDPFHRGADRNRRQV